VPSRSGLARAWIAAVAAAALAACGSPGPSHISEGAGAVNVPAATAVAIDKADPAATYYVEFRARLGSMPYGHTYMVYGRLDEAGEPVDGTTVGLLPSMGFAGLVIGTVVDVPGIIGTSTLDDVMPVLNAYRRALTAEQYEELLAAIDRAEANVPDWGLFGYNCNWFAGELATAVGMQVPEATDVMPAYYVEELRIANEDTTGADEASRPSTATAER